MLGSQLKDVGELSLVRQGKESFGSAHWVASVTQTRLNHFFWLISDKVFPLVGPSLVYGWPCGVDMAEQLRQKMGPQRTLRINYNIALPRYLVFSIDLPQSSDA